MQNPEMGKEAFKKVIIQLYLEYNVIVEGWNLRFEDTNASWIFSLNVEGYSITLIIPLIDLDIVKAAEDVVLALEELKNG